MDLALPGARPDSVASYLKALGILRLLHEQHRSRMKGSWQRQVVVQESSWMASFEASPDGNIESDVFVLTGAIAADELVNFFLCEYEPTPILSPWNGSTGFYPKDNKKTLDAVRQSQTKRLTAYRETIAIAQQIVNEMGLKKQPSGDDKNKLIRQLRDRLPDLAVRWIDTCALVSNDDIQYPPLLGTGGNDGNFEFSRTFQQQLQNLIDFKTGKPTADAETLLKAALFGETLPGLSFSGKIGQFDPIAAGGANAAPGFEGKSRVNPWDFVLMVEGTLTFQARLTRKFESSTHGALTYPFAVRPTPMGYGTAAEDENIRAETWMPLWSRPTRFDELHVFFGEGRAKVGERHKTGVDFALAVADLGKFRGIDAFVRYSFQERNGLSYFAVPLGEFRPRDRSGDSSTTNLLSPILPWLDRFRRVAEPKEAPAAIKRVHRLLETRIVEFAQAEAQPGARGNNALAVLVALGEVEQTLDRSLTWVREVHLPPIPWLRSRWVEACNDDSVEFHLALALAGRGLYRKVVDDPETQLPRLIDYPEPDRGLRQRLVRVRGSQSKPSWKDSDAITVWQGGTLTDNLLILLRREEIEAQQGQKQESAQDADPTNSHSHSSSHPATARLRDIQAWIDGTVDDRRLEAIARGLALVKRHRSTQGKDSREEINAVPAAFALLEPVVRRVVPAPTEEGTLSKDSKIVLPRVSGLWSRLEVGDCQTATELAIRRLRASRFRLAVRPFELRRDRTRRIAAALAFPIAEETSRQLLDRICYRIVENKEEKKEDGL
jgi:CRISPR-associated protein Csx17